jgi:transposase, IS6 family
VRWYITYQLSCRELVEMMVERAFNPTPTIVPQWVQHYVGEFQKR